MVLFNDIRNTLTNIVSYQHCMHYRYRLFFPICMCPPVSIHCHGLRYVFSLLVFKQMDAHTPAFINYFTHTQTRARIHSFFLTLTRGKTMFDHDQILINPKSYGHVGLHDVSVKKICVCCTVFADANLLPLYQLFFPK